jgi:hypothetical protein
MKRRTALIGLGSLATGSGAVFTSAAFSDSVGASSDMRVVVAEDLEVRAGQAFNDDGTINTSNGDITPSNYVEYASNTDFFDPSSDPEPQGLVDIDSDDLPVATVNRRDSNVNGDVKIQVAVNVDTNSVTFNDILEIENKGTSSVKVGISYDRQGKTGFGAGQYGDDVKVGGNTSNEVTEETVQYVYQFIGYGGTGTFGNGRISPDENDSGDDPANVAKIDPGAKISIDLELDLDPLFGPPVQSHIEDRALTGSNPFQQKRDTVNLLDAITVGVEDPNNPF